jgi:hypothetical protein
MSKIDLTVAGSVGQVGDRNTSTNMNVSGSGVSSSQAFFDVSSELEKLRAAATSSLGGRAPSPAEEADLKALLDAQEHAKKESGAGVLAATKRFGGWLLGIAKDIGVKLTVEVLKARLGLS